MALLAAAEFISQTGAANRPHIHGFQTARVTADDTLAEWWNGPTNAARKAAIDLNGKLYSAALTAGDILYAVAGGVSSLKRLDSLAIGTANQVLMVNAGATAPQWTSTLTSLSLASPTLTGTVAGTPTWGSTQAMNISGAAASAAVAPAAGLTGTTLAANVVTSSLTSVGTLTSLTVAGQAIVETAGADTVIRRTGAIINLTIGTPVSGNCDLYAGGNFVIQQGALITKASASGGAGFRLPHGAAPSSPVDGDEWTTTGGKFIRINGVTKTFTLT